MDLLPRPTPDPDGPRDWVDGPPSRSDPPAPSNPPTPSNPPAPAEAAAPATATPAAAVPEAAVAEAAVAEAAVAEAAAPEAAAPEAAAPEAAAPDATAPEATAPEAAVPEAALPEAAVPDAELSPVEAARARLRARGLLADGPTAPLPETPEAPNPTRPVLLDDVLAESDGHDRAAPGDEWDVASASSTLVSVSCPACRVDQQVPGDVTRFRCTTCDRAWRWAICEKCDEVGFPMERQETWRCTDCGHYTRSWWRTHTAAREAMAVVTRRRDLVARSERREATVARRRRTRVVAVAVVIAAVIAGGAAIAVTGSSSGPVTGTAETCRQFEKLRADLGSGTLDGPGLEASLRALQAASAGADPAVASATAELVAVGRPSKAAFLVAQTELADACAAATD